MLIEEKYDEVKTGSGLALTKVGAGALCSMCHNTDHDTAEGALVARSYAQRNALSLDVIVGQEVSTGEGDVVGLFLSATLPAYDTAAEAIDAIRAQGAWPSPCIHLAVGPR